MATAPPTVTPLPDPPSRDRPATFVPEANAFLGALPDLQDDLDAVAANAYDNAVAAQASAVASQASAVNSQAAATLSAAQVPLATAQAVAAAASAASAVAAPSTTATSTTSLTPGTGSKVFTTQSGKAFAAGQTLVARSASEPRQYMVGTVASYSGTTLTVTVTAFGQAPALGASADWNITFWGAVPSAAKSGQFLRLNGSTPEWGDEGGEALQVISTENLLYDSQDATGAYWNGGVLATSNVDIAPDGTKTADLIAGNRSQGKMLPEDGIYTYSRYYKQQADTYVIHRLFDAAGAAYWDTVLDFLTGQLSVASSNESILRVSDVAVGAEKLGNGWWRVWITAPCVTTLYVASDSATGSLAWGAQLRKGRSPGQYVATTTSSLASGAGARKRNLLLFSRQCDSAESANWVIPGSMTRIGKARSPAGDLSATVYQLVNTTAYLAQYLSLEADTQYTASIWVRILGTLPTFGFLLQVQYNAGGGTALDGSEIVAALGNASGEWRKYSVTFTNRGATTGIIVPASYMNDGTKVAVWGAQIEKGPRASNLIPTLGAATDGQHADIEARRTHLVDTTYAAVDIAPPEGMQPGDWFEVVDVGGNAATNNIKVLRGGVALIDGLAEDFVIDLNNWSGRFTLDAEKGLVIT